MKKSHTAHSWIPINKIAPPWIDNHQCVQCPFPPFFIFLSLLLTHPFSLPNSKRGSSRRSFSIILGRQAPEDQCEYTGNFTSHRRHILPRIFLYPLPPLSISLSFSCGPSHVHGQSHGCCVHPFRIGRSSEVAPPSVTAATLGIALSDHPRPNEGWFIWRLSIPSITHTPRMRWWWRTPSRWCLATNLYSLVQNFCFDFIAFGH